MRFKQFLEQGPASLQKTEMPYAQIKSWVKIHAPKFFKQNIPIYRGIFHAPHGKAEGLYNSRSMERKAANTHNYYNLWIDNHDDWKDYPKRKKSFVASFSSRKAAEYTTENDEGSFYYVIPKDGTPIGICPADDMWDSFDFWHMNKYMEFFHAIAKNDTDWSNFVKVTDGIKQQDLEDLADGTTEIQGASSEVARNLAIATSRKFFNLYNYLERQGFNPEFNKFKLEYAGSLDPSLKNKDRECWMAGDVMIVTEDTWEKLEDDLL